MSGALFVLAFVAGWLVLLVVLACIDYAWGERIETTYDRWQQARRVRR